MINKYNRIDYIVHHDFYKKNVIDKKIEDIKNKELPENVVKTDKENIFQQNNNFTTINLTNNLSIKGNKIVDLNEDTLEIGNVSKELNLLGKNEKLKYNGKEIGSGTESPSITSFTELVGYFNNKRSRVDYVINLANDKINSNTKIEDNTLISQYGNNNIFYFSITGYDVESVDITLDSESKYDIERVIETLKGYNIGDIGIFTAFLYKKNKNDTLWSKDRTRSEIESISMPLANTYSMSLPSIYVFIQKTENNKCKLYYIENLVNEMYSHTAFGNIISNKITDLMLDKKIGRFGLDPLTKTLKVYTKDTYEQAHNLTDVYVIKTKDTQIVLGTLYEDFPYKSPIYKSIYDNLNVLNQEDRVFNGITCSNLTYAPAKINYNLIIGKKNVYPVEYPPSKQEEPFTFLSFRDYRENLSASLINIKESLLSTHFYVENISINVNEIKNKIRLVGLFWRKDNSYMLPSDINWITLDRNFYSKNKYNIIYKYVFNISGTQYYNITGASRIYDGVLDSYPVGSVTVVGIERNIEDNTRPLLTEKRLTGEEKESIFENINNLYSISNTFQTISGIIIAYAEDVGIYFIPLDSTYFDNLKLRNSYSTVKLPIESEIIRNKGLVVQRDLRREKEIPTVFYDSKYKRLNVYDIATKSYVDLNINN